MKEKKQLSNFSLELLTMPDFMRSLKLGPYDSSGRTSFLANTAQLYGPKTLIGNWQTKRWDSPLPNLPVDSTHRIDYKPVDHDVAKSIKISTFNKGSDLWATNRGLEYLDLIRDGPRDEYQQNLATLYDLTYGGRCPEMYGKQKRVALTRVTQKKPGRDYALQYGNLTDRGLRRWKLEAWASEGPDLQRSYRQSLYTDDFKPFPLPTFDKRRSATRECSTSFNKILLENAYIKFRDLPMRFVAEECSMREPDRTRPMLNIVPEL